MKYINTSLFPINEWYLFFDFNLQSALSCNEHSGMYHLDLNFSILEFGWPAVGNSNEQLGLDKSDSALLVIGMGAGVLARKRKSRCFFIL